MNESKGLAWARPVAVELGKGWKVEEGGHGDSAYLIGPSRERVHALLGGYGMGGRVELRWAVPAELREHSRYDESTSMKISVSDTKEAATVARDLGRRLLPGLVELLELLRQRKCDSDKANGERAAFLDEITATLGGEILKYAVDRCRFGSYDALPTGEVRVMSSEVEMELRLSREQAKVVALALTRLRDGGE